MLISEQTLNAAIFRRLPTPQKVVHYLRSTGKKHSNQPGTMNVAHEINLLVEEIQRLGSKNASGQTSVKFGVLFNDDRCANIFEALVGTLKAAKKRKIIDFQSELLLQGVHDNVEIVLLHE